IPLFPAGRFSNLNPPDKKAVEVVREECGEHIKQMRHCAFCRADAAGLLKDCKTIFDYT
ncbi:nitrogenase molybdenum-iron cofactor biosynthesis protein, partial [Archaeoglobales archaeon]